MSNKKLSRCITPTSASQEKQLRIVFVRANNYDCTPAIPRALEASEGIFKDVNIICWNRSGKDEPKELMVNGVKLKQFVRAASQRSLKVVFLTLWYQVWLFWNLLCLRADVIQVCSIVSGLPAGIVALLTRRRFIYDIRDPFALCYCFPWIIRKIVYALDWCVMGLSSAFVVPTSRYIPYIGRWANSKREIVEIPNTCHDLLGELKSVERILRPKKDDKVIRLGYMGYLDESRGAGWLLEFCGDCSNNSELIVAGDCRSEKLMAAIKSTPNVTYVGRLPYKSALALMCEIDAVTIFCDTKKPSYRIADPTKFYDAMMVGKPVLVSRTTSIHHIVLEKRLGYVLEYNNMNGLHKVVEELRSSEKRAAMGKRCRQYYLDNLRLSEKLVDYRKFYSRIANQWFPDEKVVKAERNSWLKKGSYIV